MSLDPRQAATAYFDAWRRRDSDLLRSILADDVEFIGPLTQVNGADKYVESIQGLWNMTTDLVIHKMLADEDDALTGFDLHTSVAPPTPVANWCHLEQGKAARVQVTFDPRGMLGSSPH
jgi:hypothetical protein